ncbi:hypothetical protein AURDEDRAFT_161371 [Auricularia subglabra TFB-10046 SS5]|nr:hypothetical protein AURDEDRAFT_161371 [Auricularia subglabra TFB-10046 SS5]
MDAPESDEVALENLAFRLASLAFAKNAGSSEDLLVSNQILDIARRGIARAATQRNTHTRLQSAIPAEVLGLVFIRLDLDHCIIASRVCRHWRNVAFNVPALWTQLDTSKQGISYTMGQLERSGALPLTVRVHRLTPALDELLAKHMWHVKELYLDYMWFCDDVCACLASSSPALEVLWFSIEMENPITRDMFPDHQVFASLRNLTFQIGDAETCDLAAFLAMCPSLRILELDIFQVGGPGHSTGLGLRRPITSYAPLLEELRVWSDYEVFGALLPHLLCVRSLHIGPWCEDGDDADTGVVSSLFGTRPSQIAIFRVLVPACDSETRWALSRGVMQHLVSLVMSRYEWLTAHPLPRAPVLESLTLILDSERVYFARIVDDELPRWFCPALRTVCIGDRYPLSRMPFIPFADLSTLLCGALGFTSTRRLPRLVFVNALVDKVTGPVDPYRERWHEKTTKDAILMAETDPPEFVEHWELIHDVHWDGLQV